MIDRCSLTFAFFACLQLIFNGSRIDAQLNEYPDRSQLLVVFDAAGSVRPVKTKADWAERVSHIRANMQLVMGKLPDPSRRVPLDLVVVSEEQLPKYRRQKILFTPEPNDRVPAWLLIPNELPESGRSLHIVRDSPDWLFCDSTHALYSERSA